MAQDETEKIIKQAADLTFITTSKQANLLLADLNTILSGMRLDVSDLGLKQELSFNKLMKELKAQGQTEMYIKSEHRISDSYKEWMFKKGLLADIRAVRKTLSSHAEMLSSQERFGQHYTGKAYLG